MEIRTMVDGKFIDREIPLRETDDLLDEMRKIVARLARRSFPGRLVIGSNSGNVID